MLHPNDGPNPNGWRCVETGGVVLKMATMGHVGGRLIKTGKIESKRGIYNLKDEKKLISGSQNTLKMY